MTTTQTAAPDSGYQLLPELMRRMTGDEKHDAAATSTLDVLWVLFDRVLRVDPDDQHSPHRDRFLLSKGHGPMAYYAVLAARGFLEPAQLEGWGSFESQLGYHPDRVLVPGAEIGSGSLGHGLGLAVGTALGLRAQGLTQQRVFVLLGDAELDEGSNAEAIALAGRLGLDALTAVVVDNSSATHGWPGGIGARFAVEGWRHTEVSGRDHEELDAAFRAGEADRREGPDVVVARVPGKEDR